MGTHWLNDNRYSEGDKVWYDGKLWDFGYYSASHGMCVLYEVGERNMQDSIAVCLKDVSLPPADIEEAR